MPKEKKFKVSSALKNIIGKELITNDLIAVFELVKNSFDAHAKKVEVIFENFDTDFPKLIIKDNGKGMDLKDLENKWLFVAYSAKKEGTEDFRDVIQKRRTYAGAKGIGRFSCDKLGENLKVYSKRKDDNFTNILSVEWGDFEKDSKTEFINVPVLYSRTKLNPYGFNYGTVLEISGLREDWDRAKLLTLKRSLEKLINPNQKNDSENFKIYLKVTSELAEDKKIEDEEPWKRVNGQIKNFLFENLELRSTCINVKISEDGKQIISRLEDRGSLIYNLIEENPEGKNGKNLSNIEVSLFALNKSAKIYFTKHMGVRVVDFGSVFLYKNGFRIYPFGEVGDDSLGIDSRKQQGTSRFLGTRDLIGRIEINGNNPDFQETTSRDGGLFRNEAYYRLKEMFFELCLKRLERYTVDIVKYGNLAESFEEQAAQQGDVKSKVLGLIQNLTQSKNIVDIEYDSKVVDILGEISESSLQNLIKNFERLASETGNEGLVKEAKKAQKRLNQLNKAREEAEAETEKEKEARKQAEEEAKAEAERAQEAEERTKIAHKQITLQASQNLFLQSVVNQDVGNIISLHHHIGIAAGTIENYIKLTNQRIKKGKPFSTDMVLQVLENISHQAKKIITTTKFATKANFNLEATSITEDLCEYIGEYLMNICSGIIKTLDNKTSMGFVWENKDQKKFVTKLKPLEVSIILDNLIINSRKAKSKNITISVLAQNKNELELLYSDDGAGVAVDKAEKIFELGYTTTDGSGLGLYQVKNILNEMGASIELVGNSNKGAEFIMRFVK